MTNTMTIVWENNIGKWVIWIFLLPWDVPFLRVNENKSNKKIKNKNKERLAYFI